MCVCMCVCVCVCVRVCVYVCVYVYIYILVCVHTYNVQMLGACGQVCSCHHSYRVFSHGFRNLFLLIYVIR